MTSDNRFDDLRADHLSEEVLREAAWRRKIADLQTALKQAQEERDKAQEGFRFQQYLRMRLEIDDLRAERDAAIERWHKDAGRAWQSRNLFVMMRDADVSYWTERAEAAERDAEAKETL